MVAWWRRRNDWASAWLSLAVLLVGIVAVVSAVFPKSRTRLQMVAEVLPLDERAAANAVTAAIGMILILLAGGLRRRKHRAWIFAVLLIALTVVTHVAKGLDVEEAALSGVVLLLLLTTRPAFSGEPDPRSIRQASAVFAVSAVSAVLIGIAWAELRPGVTESTETPVERLRHLGSSIVHGPGNDVPGSYPYATEFFAALFGAVIVVTLVVLLRPAGPPTRMSDADDGALRALLARHGHHDSLGYFALRQDKSAVFSTSGKAAVCYRLVGDVCLASGDPIGDPEAWGGAIEQWMALVRKYAWVPAVLAASELGAEVYARNGMDALELGDEAIIDIDSFSLEGRSMRVVRQAVNRVRRAGYTVSIDRVADIKPDDIAAAVSAADHWRESETERGFSMALGRFGDVRDEDCLVVRAWDEAGALRGVLQFVPWGTSGFSLDVMRRDRESPNGIIELMVADLVAYARAVGVKGISLNFAVFRAVFERGERLGAGPVLRIWRSVLMGLSRFWQIESLYRANAKYRPRWEPRFLCFERAVALPRIGIAALEAEAFFGRPRWWIRLIHR